MKIFISILLTLNIILMTAMIYITYDLKKDRELWRLEEKKYILEELQMELRKITK